MLLFEGEDDAIGQAFSRHFRVDKHAGGSSLAREQPSMQQPARGQKAEQERERRSRARAARHNHRLVLQRRVRPTRRLGDPGNDFGVQHRHLCLAQTANSARSRWRSSPRNGLDSASAMHRIILGKQAILAES